MDKECDISVASCIDLVNLIIHEHTGVCTYNSCLGKWLCFDSNGHIYPCDRLCLEKYDLGNINDIKFIDEVFQSEKFIDLLKNSIKRRENCKLNCEYFKNCYGGCNANAILSQNENYNASCYIQKNILKEIKEYLLKINGSVEANSLNPYLRKILK